MNLYTSRSQIELIINDPRVDGVALTGSEAARRGRGRAGGQSAQAMHDGAGQRRCLLADADMEGTTNWAVFGHPWQVCSSSNRMIVVDSDHDLFLDGYRENVASLVVGNPFDLKTTFASFSSQKAAGDLKRAYPRGGRHGAKAEEGVPVEPNRGVFVQPTILTEIGEDNPARYGGSFGPGSPALQS